MPFSAPISSVLQRCGEITLTSFIRLHADRRYTFTIGNMVCRDSTTTWHLADGKVRMSQPALRVSCRRIELSFHGRPSNKHD